MQNLLNIQMKSFADKFKKFIVPLIIDYPVLDFEVLTSGTTKTLVIIIKKDKANEKVIDKAYVSIFCNLMYIMTELNAMLLSAEFDKDDMASLNQASPGNSSISTSQCSTLMSWLGAEIGPWFLDQLQRTVIAKAVPTSSKDLGGFQDVITQVTVVHEQLTEIGFIQLDNEVLLKSVENVNMLFSNKKSQSILVEARNLMTSSLHEGIAVTEDKPMGEWPPLTPGALHHNNCMFISHHLMTLGHQFASRLPPLVNPTFVSLIQQIRENGVHVFLDQIQRQRDLLLECLEGAKGFGQLEDNARSETASRSIKQVLLQLDHLQKIWKPVLPINNYKKAMGRLIDCVVAHITKCVCALEDIAQTAAQELLKLLSPIESSCGEMLVLPGETPVVELTRHVASWPRLTELQLVLDASRSLGGYCKETLLSTNFGFKQQTFYIFPKSSLHFLGQKNL
ncbi:centromere/kinetochore protein zw10-like protein [Elysia marginata]|uniref:Centromere/kinetochore protein zw10-like protein n=1 Tax=Elysia marginata TaxID=1093978 RepID=A0AAV4H3C5_9GAST|nr:centromere/kinetochore protein zw10-like protein [Elysia marginata]